MGRTAADDAETMIRRTATDDAATIICWMEAEDTKRAADISEKCLEEAWNEKNFQESLDKDYTLMAVARKEGQTVGYIVIYLAADQAELESVAVLEEARRGGTASGLLAFAFEEAYRRGVRSMTLEVRESNTAARKLYEKFHFEMIGKRKRFYQNPQEDALILGSDLRYENPQESFIM